MLSFCTIVRLCALHSTLTNNSSQSEGDVLLLQPLGFTEGALLNTMGSPTGGAGYCSLSVWLGSNCVCAIGLTHGFINHIFVFLVLFWKWTERNATLPFPLLLLKWMRIQTLPINTQPRIQCLVLHRREGRRSQRGEPGFPVGSLVVAMTTWVGADAWKSKHVVMTVPSLRRIYD